MVEASRRLFPLTGTVIVLGGGITVLVGKFVKSNATPLLVQHMRAGHNTVKVLF